VGSTARAAACSALVLITLTAVLSGCGGTAARTDGGQVVNVRERDFQISLSTTHVDAGDVVFRDHNAGPDAHELIVIRSDGGRLRLRADGMTVDEEGLEKLTVGALEPGAGGSTRELRVRLEPGTYTLLCNMYGHYMGGMHSTLVVA
jgi:uncharacterized cupredoxin-like copper-binding protein